MPLYPGGSGGPALSDVDPTETFPTPSPGVATTASRGDHQHNLANHAHDSDVTGQGGLIDYHVLANLPLEVPTPSNPGDDGKLLKASGGAVSWQTPATLVIPSVVVSKTNGDISLVAGSTWTEGSSALRLVLPASVGDKLLFTPSFYIGGISGSSYAVDVASIVSNAIVNRFANQASGAPGWYCPSTGPNKGGSVLFVVQSGDISGGNVTLSLVFSRDSGSQTGSLQANTGLGFYATMSNFGH